ncbi:MAG TPA: alpha/beta hydrolase [Microvirga sp.]|jgi:arylformamidase|nr:alpha/beta hydrolase [Microvirga sp.]
MGVMDYEAEYNNRARVPEHPGIIRTWVRDAAAYREAARARFSTLPYGASERQAIDLFEPDEPRGGTVLFVHGGYWQALERSAFSHLARGLNAHGIAVALPGYDLSPAVRVGDIVDQVRAACRALAGRGPLVVAGHSAGGHLAACMLATDWAALGAPAGLVPAAYAISGLFDLKPLVSTSVNTALGMDEAEAGRLSPLLWTPPAGTRLDAVVGGDESKEYLRQSRVIAERWGAAGVATRYEAIPGANHFTMIAPLANPDSAMTRRVADLVRA